MHHIYYIVHTNTSNVVFDTMIVASIDKECNYDPPKSCLKLFRATLSQFLLQLIPRQSCDSLRSHRLTHQIYQQMRCTEMDLPILFSRRTNGRKILVFALWLATLSRKTDAPLFPFRFPHILRHLSRIPFPFRLFTKVKRGDGILPYFL